MKKIIHYCWFGDKKPDKLAQKCIKSWKKFLPDYEIKLWNEDNFDVNSTPFSKKAYEEKKWAFVSDVARIAALREYGGIYLDTDMMITKDISDILENNFFAGWETNQNVAVGVLGVREKNHPVLEKMYSFYCNTEFDKNNPYVNTIPALLTRTLKQMYGLKFNHKTNQVLGDGVVIYANDYFYPITSDNSPNNFTDNTCMIHYYNGSWLTKEQRHINKVYSILGARLASIYYDWKYSLKHFLKCTCKLVLYPIVKRRRDKIMKNNADAAFEKFKEKYKKVQKKDYIIFYNPNWLGTATATKEIFDSVCPMEELCDDNVIDMISDLILEDNYRLIGFSAFSLGWQKLIDVLRDKGFKGIIKVIWHGSNCMNIEDYDWTVFNYLIDRLKNKNLDSLCFVKKSMYEFYKTKGYNVEFLMNTLSVDKPENIKTAKKNKEKTQIGIYASGDRWVKNFYNQLCAASMVENVMVDCTPLTPKTIEFANIINLDVAGNPKSIEREKLLNMMAQNDLNMYVTFTECAPLIPLESFEVGVPCITGNNHHYWEGHELRDYIVVNEADDVIKIHEKIELCIKNKEKVMALYKDWKSQYDIEAKKCLDSFLNM